MRVCDRGDGLPYAPPSWSSPPLGGLGGLRYDPNACACLASARALIRTLARWPCRGLPAGVWGKAPRGRGARPALIGDRLPNSGAWGWGAPASPNRSAGRATFSGAPLSLSPPFKGGQGVNRRIKRRSICAPLGASLILRPALPYRLRLALPGPSGAGVAGARLPRGAWGKAPKGGPLPCSAFSPVFSSGGSAI